MDSDRVILEFRLLGQTSRTISDTITRRVEELAQSRAWVVEPPWCVEAEPEEADEDGALGSLIVGGELELLAPNPSAPHPIEVERRLLGDAEALIAAVWDLSEQTGRDFDVWYAGEEIGHVSNGVISRGVRVGLLDEWRRHLDARGRAEAGDAS